MCAQHERMCACADRVARVQVLPLCMRWGGECVANTRRGPSPNVLSGASSVCFAIVVPSRMIDLLLSCPRADSRKCCTAREPGANCAVWLSGLPYPTLKNPCAFRCLFFSLTTGTTSLRRMGGRRSRPRETLCGCASSHTDCGGSGTPMRDSERIRGQVSSRSL